MIRRETLRNRALKSAIGAIVVYGIAFYAFDLPDWLKLTARIILGRGRALCRRAAAASLPAQTRQGVFVSTRAMGRAHA